jgi:RimJ/RimL family protein N-acetyltransferase
VSCNQNGAGSAAAVSDTIVVVYSETRQPGSWKRVVQNPFIVGEHVYLRALEVADAPSIAPWFNDSEINRFMQRHQPLSMHAEEEFLRGMSNDETDVRLGIVRKADDQLIGTAGLHPEFRCRSARFGIVIGDKSAWDRGIGTAVTRMMVAHAFETLNLNRVWLHVYEYNPRGVHVYQKVGFRTEGQLRQETYRDGRYWDVIVMGLLRDEWARAKEPG